MLIRINWAVLASVASRGRGTKLSLSVSLCVCVIVSFVILWYPHNLMKYCVCQAGGWHRKYDWKPMDFLYYHQLVRNFNFVKLAVHGPSSKEGNAMISGAERGVIIDCRHIYGSMSRFLRNLRWRVRINCTVDFLATNEFQLDGPRVAGRHVSRHVPSCNCTSGGVACWVACWASCCKSEHVLQALQVGLFLTPL